MFRNYLLTAFRHLRKDKTHSIRSGLSWWIFAVAGAGALVITVVTVSWQAVRAALANPVDSLRNE